MNLLGKPWSGHSGAVVILNGSVKYSVHRVVAQIPVVVARPLATSKLRVRCIHPIPITLYIGPKLTGSVKWSRRAE
jgi:hypothetical protein